jgi:hypothetical protein
MQTGFHESVRSGHPIVVKRMRERWW